MTERYSALTGSSFRSVSECPQGIPLRHRDSGLSKADVVRHLAFGNWDTRMTGPPKKAVSISISA